VKWRTLPSGVVEVDQGRGFAAPSLSKPERELFRAKTGRWRALALEAGRRYGVPLAWVLAVIFAESGGDANAGPNAKGFGGLMGIGPLTVRAVEPGSTRTSAADLHDAAWNVHIGTAYLGRLRGEAGEHAGELPVIASLYNAGQRAPGQPWPSQRSPWGMRENEGYISRVVRASNSVTAEERRIAPAAMGGAGGLFALALVGWLVSEVA
jgi:soluble lytic murein transglycosylase-like protein